jgi:exodeoxyribonuclease (lambda-induced)
MTSSKFATVLAKGKGGGVSKTRRDYMDAICSERGTGFPSETFSGTTAMDWGTEHEDEAVGAYEREKEKSKDVQQCVVKRVGFVELSDWIGGSPDGLVGEDGIIEVKCPNSKTHYRYLRMNKADSTWFDPTYRLQMQGNLWVTGRKWCDWISYDPRFKRPDQKLLIVRVERDEQAIAELTIKCEAFKQEALAEMMKANPF